MSLAAWETRIDLNNDGTFAAGEIVAVRTPAGDESLIEIARGNDPTGAGHLPIAGSATLELNNDAQTYAPGGNLKIGRPIRIQATFSATTYDEFRGTLARPTYPPPSTFRRNVHLEAVGPFASLVGKNVSTALYENVAVGTAIGYLLDAAGFSGSLRDLDVGQAVMAYWWLDDEDAYTALLSLLVTEGAGARLYERGDGYIVFKDRHAHLTETASTTIQSTFRSAAGGTEPLLSHPFDYSDGIQDVVNDVRRDVVARAEGAVAAVAGLRGARPCVHRGDGSAGEDRGGRAAGKAGDRVARSQAVPALSAGAGDVLDGLDRGVLELAQERLFETWTLAAPGPSGLRPRRAEVPDRLVRSHIRRRAFEARAVGSAPDWEDRESVHSWPSR